MNEKRYFTIETENKRQFIQVPKQFMIKESKYYKMSSDAKLLYGILADRTSLSISNNWVDENGRIYFIMTIESLMEIIGWGNQKATKHLKELRTFGLLESKQQGQGKPSIHYLFQIEIEEGLETQLYQQKCENHISRNVDITLLEMLNSHANNTNNNNTENINTKKNRKEKIKENIETENIEENTETEHSISDLSDKTMPNKSMPKIPHDCIEYLDPYFVKRFIKDRTLYDLDFNDIDLYTILLEAIVKTQVQDNVEVLTIRQYPYFYKTLKNMLAPIQRKIDLTKLIAADYVKFDE